MANIIVKGAGIGGMPAAYELRAKLASEHRITVADIGQRWQRPPSLQWLRDTRPQYLIS